MVRSSAFRRLKDRVNAGLQTGETPSHCPRFPNGRCATKAPWVNRQVAEQGAYHAPSSIFCWIRFCLGLMISLAGRRELCYRLRFVEWAGKELIR